MKKLCARVSIYEDCRGLTTNGPPLPPPYEGGEERATKWGTSVCSRVSIYAEYARLKRMRPRP
jgi:hypothetical protein